MEYSFTIQVDRPLTDEQTDILYNDERFLDVGVGESGDRQRGFLAFTINEQSVTGALEKALLATKAIGLTPIGIEDDDAVTATQIAERTERSRQSIQQLIKGTRGPGRFPAPWNDDPALYSWAQVARWFTNELHEQIPYDADAAVIAATSHVLRANNLVQLNQLGPVMNAIETPTLAAA